MKPGRSLLGSVLAAWLAFAVVTTVVVGLVAAAVQQDLRRGADDPQIQVAEDAARALGAGQAPRALVPATPVDLAASLAPYLMIFDDGGRLLAGSAVLDGAPPELPPGVFAAVRQAGEDRFTWQPRPGVRSAVVVTRAEGPAPGFVLAGRSLREVEAREDDLRTLVLLAWLAGVGLSLCTAALLVWTLQRTLRSS